MAEYGIKKIQLHDDLIEEIESGKPTDYATIVYFNSTNPTTATIFDNVNPPVTNDPLLKENTDNLYIGTDNSTWVYNGTVYSTKVVPSSSNFYIDGTNTDAGNNKTSAISRTGSIIVEAGDYSFGVYARGAQAGVYGFCDSSGDAGVFGEGVGVGGVWGSSDNNFGVLGHSNYGIGVQGYSNNSVAGEFGIGALNTGKIATFKKSNTEVASIGGQGNFEGNSFNGFQGFSTLASDLLSKLPKGTYTGTASDLANDIVSISTGVQPAGATTTNSPNGTGIASWIFAGGGTYTNYGGLVIPANHVGFITRSATNTYSFVSFELDLSLYAKRDIVEGDLIPQILTFNIGSINSTTGVVDTNDYTQKHTNLISLEGKDYFDCYGMRGYEGVTSSLLSLYDVNSVFIASLVNNSTNGAIADVTIHLKDYPTAKYARLACNNNPSFLSEVTLDLGITGLVVGLEDANLAIEENAIEIQNTKDLLDNLEKNKVNRFLQKNKLYVESLLNSANITTNNAQTTANFYPAIINNAFDYTKYRSSLPMMVSGVNFPQPYFATPSTPRALGNCIEFKISGRYLEIAGRETFYYFSLMVNGEVKVKNFASSTSTAGYDAFGRLWTKIDLGYVLSNAHIKLYWYGAFAGVSTEGAISLFEANRLRIIADGDSIFEGSGAGNASSTLIYSMMGVLSYSLDLDLYNASVGGSGFLAVGNNLEPNMVNRFSTYISPYDCDVFISGGGLNDGYTTYPQNVQNNVISYFSLLNSRYRNTNTKVVIVSPFEPHPDDKPLHLGILGIRDKEKELCIQYGFGFIDMIDGITYDEMGNVVQDSSVTLGGLLDQGREPLFYHDGTHPNELGHNYCGKRIMTEMYRLLR